MKIVTVATNNQRYFPYLVESCKRHNCHLDIIGWDQKWQGFSWRYKLMLEYLQKQNPDEIICFVDAYDVIILQEHDIIVKNFKELIGNNKNSIVISRETKTESIYNKLADNITLFERCNNYFINAGTYIGYAGTLYNIIETLSQLVNKPDDDDQILIQKLCKSNKDLFIIDQNSSIFYVLANCRKYDPINPDLVPKNTCILHAPCYGNLDDIIAKLGYDTNLYKTTKKDYDEYYWKSIYHFFKTFIKNYGLLILLIIVFIVLILVVNKI